MTSARSATDIRTLAGRTVVVTGASRGIERFAARVTGSFDVDVLVNNAGVGAFANGSCYTASKYAQRAFTRALQMEVEGDGVRVTEVRPGRVATYFGQETEF